MLGLMWIPKNATLHAQALLHLEEHVARGHRQLRPIAGLDHPACQSVSDELQLPYIITGHCHCTCPLQGMRRASPAPAALERDHELHAGTAVPVVLQAYGKLGENDLYWRRSLLHKLLALCGQCSTVSRSACAQRSSLLHCAQQ